MTQMVGRLTFNLEKVGSIPANQNFNFHLSFFIF